MTSVLPPPLGNHTSAAPSAGGYSPLLLQLLSRRRLATEGAFFLPYLRPGMRILDCGCGPGTMTVDLARIVAPGMVIGIDIAPRQCDIGRTRARAQGVANVQFAGGDIYNLPFPDSSFDAVFVHAVLYHLCAPHRALMEIYRVIKPGGLVGVRDADHGGDLWAPATEALEHALALTERVLRYQGGNPGLGRTHRALLRAAGFVRIAASASYESFGTPEATQALGAYWAEFLGRVYADWLCAQGWATPAVLAQVGEALTAWGRHPDAFFARARCAAVGWKEAP